MKRRFLLWSVFAIALSSFATAEARAQETERRAAILPVEGRGNTPRQVERAVIDGLAPRFRAVSDEAVTSAIRRNAVDTSTAEGKTALAREVQAHVLVSATSSGRGRDLRVTFVFFDYSGAEVARGEGGAPSGRTRQALVDSIRETAGRVAATLDSRDAERRAAEAQAEAAEQGRIAGEIAGEGVDESSEADAVRTGIPLLALSVGLTGLSRHATVTLAETGDERTQDLDFWAALTFRLDLRPFARSSSATSGLWARIDAEWMVPSTSKQTDIEDGEEVETTALRLALGAGYLAPVADGVQVGGLLSFGYDDFSLSGNEVMPSRTYTYLRIGPAATVEFMGPQLGLELGAGLRYALSTGDFANVWADDASAIGFDGELALGGKLDMGLTYAVRTLFSGYSVSFEGEGDAGFTAEDGFDWGIYFGGHIGYALQ